MTTQQTGYTPGPWAYNKVTFGHPDNAKNPIVGSAENYIARLFSTEATFAGLTSRAPSASEAEANARLIAASPDLLEALQSLLPALDHDYYVNGMKQEYREGYRLARNAIAKALGDTDAARP